LLVLAGRPVAAVHLIDELDQEVAALRGIVAGVLQTGVAEGFSDLAVELASELGEMLKQIGRIRVSRPSTFLTSCSSMVSL
jgi:hypothetical protein